MEYTNLEIGIEFLPYWNDDTTDWTEQADEQTDLNDIELPF
jgi:hypothetical protein